MRKVIQKLYETEPKFSAELFEKALLNGDDDLGDSALYLSDGSYRSIFSQKHNKNKIGIGLYLIDLKNVLRKEVNKYIKDPKNYVENSRRKYSGDGGPFITSFNEYKHELYLKYNKFVIFKPDNAYIFTDWKDIYYIEEEKKHLQKYYKLYQNFRPIINGESNKKENKNIKRLIGKEILEYNGKIYWADHIKNVSGIIEDGIPYILAKSSYFTVVGDDFISLSYIPNKKKKVIVQDGKKKKVKTYSPSCTIITDFPEIDKEKVKKRDLIEYFNQKYEKLGFEVRKVKKRKGGKISVEFIYKDSGNIIPMIESFGLYKKTYQKYKNEWQYKENLTIYDMKEMKKKHIQNTYSMFIKNDSYKKILEQNIEVSSIVVGRLGHRIMLGSTRPSEFYRSHLLHIPRKLALKHIFNDNSGDEKIRYYMEIFRRKPKWKR